MELTLQALLSPAGAPGPPEPGHSPTGDGEVCWRSPPRQVSIPHGQNPVAMVTGLVNTSTPPPYSDAAVITLAVLLPLPTSLLLGSDTEGGEASEEGGSGSEAK